MSSGEGSLRYPQKGRGIERPFNQERDMPERLRGGTFGKRAKTALERAQRQAKEFWRKVRRAGAI
ncbi:MAG TPA: hypothetical protein VEW42_03415 [Candidatus Eisenbacteria bacterium]|nr:hypothetical protein [Candidatus Eisenbacteria bacterium]